MVDMTTQGVVTGARVPSAAPAIPGVAATWVLPVPAGRRGPNFFILPSVHSPARKPGGISMEAQSSGQIDTYRGLKDRIYEIAERLAAEIKKEGIDPEFATALAQFTSSGKKAVGRNEENLG